MSNLFQLNYPVHVSNKQVRQEVISVHAAYSISHASIECLAANTIIIYGVSSRQHDTQSFVRNT